MALACHVRWILIASLAFSVCSVQAANQTWQGDVSSNWQTTGNWNGNALPGIPDTAFFANSATTTTPTLSETAIVGTINISGNTAFTFSMTGGAMYLRNATALTSTSSATQTFGGNNYRGAATGNAAFVNNGTGLLDFTVPIYKEDSPGGGNSTNTGNLVFNGSGDFVVNRVGKRFGNLQAGLTKSGNGTLTIEAAMTSFNTTGGTGTDPQGLTNTVTVSNSGGTLRIMDRLAVGTGNITIATTGTNTGTLELALTGTNTIDNTFNGFASATRFGLGGNSPQIANISGINTITSNLTITSGGGSGLVVASNGGLLTLAGTLSATFDAFRSVSLGGTAEGLVSGAIVDGAGGGLNVNKEQSGEWTLTGANTYTGVTNVFAGTLMVNGTHSGGGAYAVSDGATLGGTGSIAASAINVAGTMAPGASVGSLAVTGPVNFLDTSVLGIEIDEFQAGFVDLLAITGDLTIADGAEVGFDVTGPLTQSEYVFGTYTGSLTGLFTSSSTPMGYVLQQGGGELKLVLVPEPRALAMIAFGAVVLGLSRSRRWRSASPHRHAPVRSRGRVMSMSRRRARVARVFAWLIVVVVLGVRGPRVVAAEATTSIADPQHPNILMIMIDDLNDWVGVMGGHPGAVTPNIDRLAQRGMLFTNAHCAAPLCGPTRAALLSGLRPSTTGIYGHNSIATLQRLPAIAKAGLLPAYFARHGYKTLGTGKIFHTGAPAQAFDVIGPERADYGPRPKQRLAYAPPPPGTGTDWGAFPNSDEEMPDTRYARWAVQQLRQPHDRPFFMGVGFVRPHVPWHVPQKWFDMHPLELASRPPFLEDDMADLPETARRFAELTMMPTVEWMKQERRWEKSVQAYLACTTFTDHCVGQVLDALAESQHAGNTIVVLVSDHGYSLGEKGIWAKHSLWERATRVPLIIARPTDQQARTCARPVNHIDLYPTLLELAHLPPNASNEGKSLVPLLDNPEAPGYEASLTTHGCGNHAVRTDRWRYIRYADGAQELYDHMADPNEWHNLATNATSSDVIAQLQRYLPKTDAPTNAAARGGLDYNPYLKELSARKPPRPGK